MIHNFVPMSINKNIGKEYNYYMSLVPKDDDYALFKDHDCLPTTYEWYNHMNAIVKAHPQVACFNVRSNRIDCRWQRYPCDDTNDFMYHWKLGHEIFAKYGLKVKDCTTKGLMSGLVMVIKKSAWRKVGGFREDGILGVDNHFHKRLIAHRQRVYLMEGIYFWHWYSDNRRLGKKHLL